MINNYTGFLSEIEDNKDIHIKVKGTDVGRPTNAFNNSLAIIKKGLINHFVEGKDFYTTIKENQNLLDYQIIVKRSSKTVYMDVATEQELPDKVLRLFPVTSGGMRIKTTTFKDVPNVPEQAIMVKENILGMTIKDIPNFDINYYIEKFNDKLEHWNTGGDDEDEESFEEVEI